MLSTMEKLALNISLEIKADFLLNIDIKASVGSSGVSSITALTPILLYQTASEKVILLVSPFQCIRLIICRCRPRILSSILCDKSY